MKAKEKPIVCVKFGDKAHTNGGLGGVHNAHRYSVIISFFGVFRQCFTCFLQQKVYKSHILRRLLSLVSHIACIALGGIIGNRCIIVKRCFPNFSLFVGYLQCAVYKQPLNATTYRQIEDTAEKGYANIAICGSANAKHQQYHVVSAFVAENQITLFSQQGQFTAL